MHSSHTPFWNRLAACWGIVGFVALIGQALFRFYPTIKATLMQPMSTGDVARISTCVILFALGKGYFILQKRFAPRFAVYVRELATPPTRLTHGVLAPLYCMGLVGGDKSRTVRGLLLVAAIVIMIIGAKRLPTPWYTAVLIGVAIALAWGALAVAIQSIRSLATEPAADNTLQPKAYA